MGRAVASIYPHVVVALLQAVGRSKAAAGFVSGPGSLGLQCDGEVRIGAVGIPRVENGRSE